MSKLADLVLPANPLKQSWTVDNPARLPSLIERSMPNSLIECLPASLLAAGLGYQLAILLLLSLLLYSWIPWPKKQNTFPSWAVLEIAITSLIVTRGGVLYRIYSVVRRYGGSLFGLTNKHQVLVNLPGVDRVMSQSFHTLNAEPMQYTLFTRVFGATDSAQLKLKLETSWKDLLKPIEDMFLNDAGAIAALQQADIAAKANSFVTFAADSAHMQRWERSADLRLIKPKSGGHTAVEANLQSIARDFGACIAIPLLYGHDFLDRYPGVLDDFWKFDNDAFPLLMIGLPTWTPLRMLKDGVAARSRLLDEMDSLYRRIDQYQNGEAVDCDADMSDISAAALGRNTVYVKKGWSFRERAGGDLAILWGQNANTQAIFFWVLFFVYSTKELLGGLREEIAPYVDVSGDINLQITSMDLPALFANCPRFKAAIFETYRMANEATSIRYVERPLTIADGAHKHKLKQGMFVSAPHSIIQRDPTVYEDPDEFVPDRFLSADPETGKLVARYGKLRSWGSGAAMCKGRSFAEKEIIALSAAIISVWDIWPASGSWDSPAMVPGTGVKKPVNDVRVVITPRKRR